MRPAAIAPLVGAGLDHRPPDALAAGRMVDEKFAELSCAHASHCAGKVEENREADERAAMPGTKYLTCTI